MLFWLFVYRVRASRSKTRLKATSHDSASLRPVLGLGARVGHVHKAADFFLISILGKLSWHTI